MKTKGKEKNERNGKHFLELLYIDNFTGFILKDKSFLDTFYFIKLYLCEENQKESHYHSI